MIAIFLIMKKIHIAKLFKNEIQYISGSGTKKIQSIKFSLTSFYKYSSPNPPYQFSNPILIQFYKKN